MAVLDGKCPEPKPGKRRDLDFYMTAVARLDGYLARRHDPPPGTTVLRRGFSRLADLVSGFEFANPDMAKTCGQLKAKPEAYFSGRRSTYRSVQISPASSPPGGA